MAHEKRNYETLGPFTHRSPIVTKHTALWPVRWFTFVKKPRAERKQKKNYDNKVPEMVQSNTGTPAHILCLIFYLTFYFTFYSIKSVTYSSAFTILRLFYDIHRRVMCPLY
jgi:hypothetical protein